MEKGYAVEVLRTADDEHLGELMRAAQQGDSDAYLNLLTEITPRIRRTLLRRAGTTGAAEVEDLVQDVLLSVHVARATYQADRPFLPWLLAIVRHRFADGVRRRVRLKAHEIQVEELDVTFESRAANSMMDGTPDVQALSEAVRSLPSAQREAIELLKLRELSLKEASTLTGASVGSLKVATHRAMLTLRRMLVPGKSHGH